MNGYETTISRAAVAIASVAMTAITIVLLIVLPAKMKPEIQEVRTLTASRAVTSAPTADVISRSLAIAESLRQMITQDSSARTLTYSQ